MHFLFWFILYPLSLLPLFILYGIGGILYFFLNYVVRYRRKVIDQNLRNSFPEKNPKELAKIRKQYYLNTISVSNLMMENKQLKDRILLEYVPSGQEHLQTIIGAMKESVLLNIIYHSYWRDEDTTFDVMPLCIKLFRQRWYMVGQSHGCRIYALDRIKSITKTEKKFKMPKAWKAEEFFDGCFGIIVDNNVDKQTVKLKPHHTILPHRHPISPAGFLR